MAFITPHVQYVYLVHLASMGSLTNRLHDEFGLLEYFNIM